MIDLLVNNPLLLLFIIAAISYPLGRLKVKGTSLGVAMVLFVSIAVGALDPRLKLPATKEERRDLVRMMIEKVGVDVAVKRMVWVKSRPDFDVLFQLSNHLRVDEQRRFWIAYPKADKEMCGTEEVME